jgi:glucan phosphoethanolaminetransferase (alkaline phosphatase superfamily)
MICVFTHHHPSLGLKRGFGVIDRIKEHKTDRNTSNLNETLRPNNNNDNNNNNKQQQQQQQQQTTTTNNNNKQQQQQQQQQQQKQQQQQQMELMAFNVT